MPSRVTVKSTFNQTLLDLKSSFLSLYTLCEVNFQRFLRCQSSCDRGELVLCFDKPRRDFDFKQRPSLAYYNKGSARFIITKANKGAFCICIRIFLENKEPSEKNFRAMLLRRNEADMPKFRTFRHDFFFHPNRHLAWFCTHPFNFSCETKESSPQLNC